VDALLPIIETPRLALRLAQPGMEASMARFFAENFSGHLDRWSPPPPPGMDTSDHWAPRLARALDEYASGSALRFVLQPPGPAEGPVLGTANYTNVVRGPFQACFLGYQIARGQEGRGLMHEALSASNAWIFREWKLHRIMANHVPENGRSGRLLERLGFTREGVAKDYLFIHGAWRDHVLTALVNPDFDPAWLAPA
jgi:[ribosomal protein S5]-alanine N-acetyltransferase